MHIHNLGAELFWNRNTSQRSNCHHSTHSLSLLFGGKKGLRLSCELALFQMKRSFHGKTISSKIIFLNVNFQDSGRVVYPPHILLSWGV